MDVSACDSGYGINQGIENTSMVRPRKLVGFCICSRIIFGDSDESVMSS